MVTPAQENHLRVGNHDIKGHGKYLRVYIDAILSMVKHTDRISRSAYLQIRRISSIPPSPDGESHCSACVLLFSVDWTTAAFLLLDINCDQMYRLQKVQNNAAKVVFRKSRHEHVRPLLRELHWLPVKDRIIF